MGFICHFVPWSNGPKQLDEIQFFNVGSTKQKKGTRAQLKKRTHACDSNADVINL